MKCSTSSSATAQSLSTEGDAATSFFPLLCVYFHRTFYTPPSSFPFLRAFSWLLPSLLKRCCFSPSRLFCSGDSSSERQETPELKAVYLDASYILLRLYCALTNLQLCFIPLRYPSAHAAATLPAAWCDDRLLQLRQILALLQQTRDLDALAAAAAAAASASASHSTCTAATAAGGRLQEGGSAAAAAAGAGSACAAAAAAGARAADTEVSEKDLAAAAAAAADDFDAEMLRRGLQQQSAAAAAFIEQRLGSALQYILWVYEPCRKHFTFPAYTQNLPLIYVTPLLLWTRRQSLQQEQARPLKEVLLDVIAVLELLALQQLQQQVRRRRQHREKKKQQQFLEGDDKQQGASFFREDCADAVSAETVQQQPKSQQQQQLVDEEAATTVETAPGTEAAAAAEEEEEEEEEKEEKEGKKQCLTGRFAASEEKERLHVEFLLVPDTPTLADVYLYAYLFVLLQLPPHLLPWHEEETAASSAVPSLPLTSSSSSAPAAAASMSASIAAAAASPAAASELGGSAWLSSDTSSLLNFCDDARVDSSAAAYQLLQQQQDKHEEHLYKQKIVQLLPLARQYLQHFDNYLFQLRGVCVSHAEIATAAAATPTAAAAATLAAAAATPAAAAATPAAAGGDVRPARSAAGAVSAAEKTCEQAGETAVGSAEKNTCLACLPPLAVRGCSAARAALYDRGFLQQQQQRGGSDSDRRRDSKRGDAVDSTQNSSSRSSTKSSSRGAALVSKDCEVAVCDEEVEQQRSSSRDTKMKQAAVSGKSAAAAAHVSIRYRKKLPTEDSATRGFLAVAAAAAAGALVLYIGATTRADSRGLIRNY